MKAFRKFVLKAAVTGVCLLVSAFPASAQDAIEVPAGVEAAVSKALGLTPTLTQTLGPQRLPPTSVTGDFGYALAVSDKYVVIGSPADTIVGGGSNQNGSVYIFERVNSTTAPWKLLDRLVPGTTSAERFGQSVAVSGDLVVIGAPGLKGNTVNGGVGRAFVYVRDPAARSPPYFIRRDTLAGTDPPGTLDDITNTGAAFGESVGAVVQKFYNFFTGTTTTTTHVFVGAPQANTRDPADDSVERTGVVLVYRCTVGKALPPSPPTYTCATGDRTGGPAGGPAQPGKLLLPPFRTVGADFGQSLSVVPPKPTSLFVTPQTITLAVGSPDGCSNCLIFPPPPALIFGGAAFVFYGSGPSWGNPTYIRPGTGIQDGDDFGDALAFNGTQLAIGAPRDNGLNGTVRIHQKSASSASPCGVPSEPACIWSPVQTIGPGTSGFMLFGQRVAFYGNQLLVGAPNRQVVLNTLQGSVFYFDRPTSTSLFSAPIEITRSGVTGDTNYGSAVALMGGSLLVGEKNGPNGGASPPGRVYTYTLTPPVARTPNPTPTATQTDRFGTITVLRDGVMVVGVPGASSGNLANVGLVRVYVPNPAAPGTHMLVQTILPPPGESVADLRFGHALALTANGNRILIGAPGADAVPGDGSVVPVGAVFVFNRSAFASSWTLPTTGASKLLHPTPQQASDFGASIDVDPDGALLVVGAPNADRVVGGSSLADVGAVTVFRNALPAVQRGEAQGKATFGGAGEDVPPPPGAGFGDKWGSSVATDGDAVVAGAPETGSGGAGEDGYVTVIDDSTGGTFDTEDMIDSPVDDPEAPNDEQDFGSAVDIDDGMVAVGAPGTDMSDEDASTANTDEGAVYGYSLSGEPPQASEPEQMEQPSGALGDKWGTSVAVDNGTVAAGGPGVDVPPAESVAPPGCTVDSCPDQGAVALYECEVIGNTVFCGYDDTVYGNDAEADEGIGSSVALDGDTIAAGAPDAGTNDQGAVYAAEDDFNTDGVFRDGFE